MKIDPHISPGKRAWKKFRSNPLSIVGASFILLLSLISLLGPFIRPDNSPNANRQLLQISRQKPGFNCDVLVIRFNDDRPQLSLWESWIEGGQPPLGREIPLASWRWEGPVMHYTAFGSEEEEQVHAADILFPLDVAPECDNSACRFNTSGETRELSVSELQSLVETTGISHRSYLLGTDKFGRDLLSRLMAGAIISLSVGFIAVLISLLIGLFLGALAGYYGGKADAAIMWLINVIWSIPTLLLVIAITFAFGKGFWTVFLAVGLTMWVEVARVVRGQFLSLREKEYVEAGKVLGFSDLRIIFRHILPNAIGPVIVIAAANFASAILVEAGLSFLGIGAQIPIPSWGNMIKEHYNLITTDLAYLALLPGLCIMMLVLAFMLVGNGLRDAFDVRN